MLQINLAIQHSYTCCLEEPCSYCESLLSKDGLDINAKDRKGKTALFYATQKNHSEIVELLSQY
ncbi:hypothetical protein CPB84DRAFT_1884884, partial [Gymnopilus junonius]